jgi:protoheme IX farnesyltransferase
VILGGAFVRASISGDGCGTHWPTCQGQLIPETSNLATWIEFGHRLSTGVLLPVVIAFVVWAYRMFPKGHPARPASVWVLLLTIVEALIGAGLVLFQWVARDESVGRAFAMPAHLVTTFLLLAALTLAIWWSREGSEDRPLRLRGQGALGWAIGLGLLATLLLGMTGAIVALGDTLFPAASHAEGFRQNFSPEAHFLIRLRIYHPLMAIATGLYLMVITGMCMHLRPASQGYARAMALIFTAQMCAGAVNYALMAPVWMQLVHLLLADLFWISLVLTAVSALSSPAAAGERREARGEGYGSPEHLKTRPYGHTAARIPYGRTPEHLAAQPATGNRQPAAGFRGVIKDYLALTKPRVVSLLLFTTLAAMFIAAGTEPGLAPNLWLCLAVGAGLYMAAGAANAINMVLERDLDLRMGRTATRPTVTEAIPAASALRFAVALMLGSFALLTWAANLLSALLALAGLGFYVLVYTLLLKRRTWYNIVIGGAAGAFPPLVGWAAITGDLSPLAWVLFGIIFLWTPVHFWALAIVIKDDYARAGVPMLPVVRGERATVVQIGYYTLLTVAISVLPLVVPSFFGHAAFGWLYVGAALVLNGVLALRSFQLYRQPDRARAASLFKYSMVYLALLFLAMAVDRGPWI